MSDRQVRKYDGRLRAERAAGTRRRIVDAAIVAFGTRGYTRTTMADLAGAAGVSVDTVYANGPKAALLQAAVRVSIFGVESDQPFEEYDVGRRLLAAADPQSFLEVLTETFSAAIPRVAPLWAAFEAAADSHVDVGDRRDELLDGAVTTLRTLVRTCADRGWLRGTLTEEQRMATLYTVGTPGTVHLVMRDLGVDDAAYVSWMRATVAWALFGAAPGDRR